MTTATTPAAPKSPEELIEYLMALTPAERIDQDGTVKEVVKAYAQSMLTTSDISAQVAKETKATMDAWLKEQGVKRPNMAGRDQTAYSRKAPGAVLDNMFDGAADYFKAIHHLNLANDPRIAKIRNDYSSVVGADGGFLVPEVLRSELLKMSLETAIVRPRSRVIPMESASVPFPMIRDTTHAANVYGGLVGYWTPESGALTESQASFGQVKLEARKLTTYCEVPNELIADSAISFEAFINTAMPEALAYFEDVAFLTGSGAGEPLGFLNGGAVVSVAKETGQLADTILWENIVKVYARMLPQSLGRAVFVANIDTFPQLALMSLAVGTGGSAIWLNNGVVGPPMTILGRPVLFTEKVPTLGDAGDLIFVDFGYYLIGDRQAMSASSSPHFKFQNDQIAYRVIERVDGRPWMDTALTPRNGTNTLSPIVQIAARA